MVTLSQVIRETKGPNELQSIPVMLVGNKCDENENREVSVAEGEAEAQRWGCHFMETSAKTNHNVKELFQVPELSKIAKIIFQDGCEVTESYSHFMLKVS